MNFIKNDIFHGKLGLIMEFLKSILGGLIATSIDILVLVSFTEYIGFNYMLSAIMGGLAGLIFNYWFHIAHIYNDIDTDSHLIAISKFTIISIFTIFINLSLLYILTEFIGAHYLISKVLATFVSFAMNFVLRKIFIFQNS